MFRQHPGCYKAVLLKKTHTIILRFDEYTVYIIYWIMMLYDWYCIIVIFCPNIIAFCSLKLDYSKSSTEFGIKIITINWNIAVCCIYEWMKCSQKRKNIDKWFILLRDIILLRKNQLVTSYSLKIDVNRLFEFRLCQIVNMYRNLFCHLLRPGFVSM